MPYRRLIAQPADAGNNRQGADMIDMHALTSLTREAVGSAVLARMVPRDERSHADHSAILRALSYVLGAHYNTPEWSPFVTDVRAIIDQGAQHTSSNTGASIAVASKIVAGALLTLVDPNTRYPLSDGYYTRDADTGRIWRMGDGFHVEPDDDDWLTACGYMSWTETGSIAHPVSASS